MADFLEVNKTAEVLRAADFLAVEAPQGVVPREVSLLKTQTFLLIKRLMR